MKTVNEWLQELPEPYRTQALENMNAERAEIEEDSIGEALLVAFYWSDSPQGLEYWSGIHNKTQNNETLTEMNKRHPHAELAIQYWTEAREDVEAWKNWEYQDYYGAWCCCHASPEFRLGTQYRRKPRTININGQEVPEPLRVKPKIGEVYYVANLLDRSNPHMSSTWYHDSIDIARFDAGICHSTKEAAIAHAKALLSFTQGGGEA